MSNGALGRVYGDGEIVVREGDMGSSMYVIQEGEVEVFVTRDGKEIPLRTLGAGEILGEMSVFDREVRSATVRARGEARLLTVDKESFLRRVHEDPSLAFRIVQTLSRRVRDLSAELARLRAEREG